MKKYDYIDALRALAIVLVVFVHYGQGMPQLWHWVWFSQYGQYGVQLFFVLSAFTLCNSVSEIKNFGAQEYRKFMLRRFLRISPLYYFAIPVYFLYGTLTKTVSSDYSGNAVLTNLAFLHGLSPPANNSVVPGGWSIGCEFLFYAIFPALFCSKNSPVRPIILFTIASFSIVCILIVARRFWGLSAAFNVQNNGFLYFSIFNQASCFSLGIFCYHFRDSQKFIKMALFASPFACFLLVYCHGWRWGPLFTPFFAGLVSVSLIFALRGISIPSLVRRIGQYSFSIYIWHFISIGLTKEHFGHLFVPGLRAELLALILLFLLFALTYFIASLSHKYIELPFIRLGQSFSRKTA